uniref:YceD family protein n=2 Tax=Flavobacterium sp. TaxID=239 RepID=UPI0040494E0D
MKVTNEFLIPFIGLKQGKHQFDFIIENKFFTHFEYQDFENSNINVQLILEKKSTMLELHFKHKGVVHVPCDLTSELFDLPIKGSMNIIVQFGDAFNDENDELLILPHGEHQVDISQYIYEMIVLSVPTKRVHPGVKDGSLQSEALEKLEKMSVKKTKINKEDKNNNTDPRWDKLKNLLTDK